VSEDVPGVESTLRGLVYFQIDVYGANSDLHSGLFGGAVPNPANVLTGIIGSLHDAKGRVTVPGFYDDVRTATKNERAALARIPHSDAAYRKQLGLRELQGEAGYTTIERTTIRPTLDVNGIWGGFTGHGSKTVIPREAHAKVSMRLVANQDPRDIEKKFLAHIKKITPSGVRVEAKRLDGAAYPYTMPSEHVGYIAAERALHDVFKKKPLRLGSGGSIPVVPMFERLFGIKTVLMGFGLPTDNLHAPNEHFSLKNFYRGIESIPRFYAHLADMWPAHVAASQKNASVKKVVAKSKAKPKAKPKVKKVVKPAPKKKSASRRK
jgi:acetylornithine deacetylase/succinyl-diaminopimelate desuccinylase-like protein